MSLNGSAPMDTTRSNGLNNSLECPTRFFFISAFYRQRSPCFRHGADIFRSLGHPAESHNVVYIWCIILVTIQWYTYKATADVCRHIIDVQCCPYNRAMEMRS